jgi:redox-sensitive bicupin YhaK (pirin superfamily)
VGESASEGQATKPRYQDIQGDHVPEVELGPGATARVHVGTVNGVKGPVMEVATEPVYFDLHLEPNASHTATLPEAHNAFVYVYQGDAKVGAASTSVQRSGLAMFHQAFADYQAGRL